MSSGCAVREVIVGHVPNALLRLDVVFGASYLFSICMSAFCAIILKYRARK